ncbi:hypothetical protein L7F22_013001 [Adiantum nelumboides]|nr:hypothetical protein [Adiantum nelumboides]
MGYAQWRKVTLQVVSSGGTTLEVKNAKLDYSKWYKATPTEDKDTKVASPGRDTFANGSPLVFASCDRTDSPSRPKATWTSTRAPPRSRPSTRTALT